MQHERRSNRLYDKYKRTPEARKFYKGKAWRATRKVRLIKDNYLCQPCFRDKTITKANAVHHKKELVDYPELALDISNLESICNSCHNKHHREKGGWNKKEKLKSDVSFSANEELG